MLPFRMGSVPLDPEVKRIHTTIALSGPRPPPPFKAHNKGLFGDQMDERGEFERQESPRNMGKKWDARNPGRASTLHRGGGRPRLWTAKD